MDWTLNLHARLLKQHNKEGSCCHVVLAYEKIDLFCAHVARKEERYFTWFVASNVIIQYESTVKWENRSLKRLLFIMRLRHVTRKISQNYNSRIKCDFLPHNLRSRAALKSYSGSRWIFFNAPPLKKWYCKRMLLI